MPKTICVTHPGKMGDALYALMVAKALAKKRDTMVDFYTSEYCRPLEPLVRYQSFINNFIVPKDYKVERMDMGVQPWRMPVPDKYDAVYHLGFRQVPTTALHEYMAFSVGLDPSLVELSLEAPDWDAKIPSEYYTMSMRGSEDYRKIAEEFVTESPLPVIEVGGIGDAVSEHSADMTGENFLTTASIIKGSNGFLGIMSSQLVVANMFDIPRVTVHDGKSWDMRHAVRSPKNTYLVHPKVEEIFSAMSQTYSRTMPQDGHSTFEEAQHIENMKQQLSGVPYRFEHPHRTWEYATALAALRSANCKNVLEVGGGGSLFAPSAAWVGINMTVLDPYDASDEIRAQTLRLGKDIQFINDYMENYTAEGEFDAVVALSVIEHVMDDDAFLKQMAHYVKPDGLLVLTTDFHPSGEALVNGHLRTYNENMLMWLASSLPDFEVYGGEFDYESHSTPIFGRYTFASLVLQRKV